MEMTPPFGNKHQSVSMIMMSSSPQSTNAKEQENNNGRDDDDDDYDSLSLTHLKIKVTTVEHIAQSTSTKSQHHKKKKRMIITSHQVSGGTTNTNSNTNTNTSTSSSNSSNNSGSNRRRFINELFQGIFIYMFCISAPVILGIVVKWYEHYTGKGKISHMEDEYGYSYEEYYNYDDNNIANNHMNTNHIPTSSRSNQEETSINRENNYYNNQQFDSTSSGTGGATNNNPYDSSSTTTLLFFTEQIFNTISKLIFSSTSVLFKSHDNHHHFAAKVMTFVSTLSRDVQFIIIATILQSIVRVILVHLLVPRYLAPKRLVAFVRNKSTHLLSSAEYVWNDSNDTNSNNINSTNIEPHSNSSPSRRESFIKLYINNAWEHSGRSFRRSLGHDTKDGLSPARIHKHYTASITTKTTSNTSLPSLPSLNHLNQMQTSRLFAAPRFATAIFRLICCIISCTWALVHFRNASYWPIWVGGSIKGHTKYCWDLAGTVDPSFVWKRNLYDQYSYHQHQEQQSNLPNSKDYNNPYYFGYSSNDSSGGGFDSDFDNQNSALRYFFLGQASYQLQSLWFHFLSMALLLLYGGMKRNKDNKVDPTHHQKQQNDDDKEIVSERSSFKSYLRPVLEHSMCMFITITTFFFSSLRRLGSISIFALEMSSLVLQLLQICINAPESSRLHKPYIIRFVHRYLAIPVFVYCRLFVIPFVVQYSIIFESRVWLRQLDHAFVPGCGKLVYYVFNGALLITFMMNVIYLRRLIIHPYIQSISR